VRLLFQSDFPSNFHHPRACKSAASFLATTYHIEMAYAFQKTACVPPVGSDTILSCSDASLVNRLEKVVFVYDPNLSLDTLFQKSA